MLGLQQTEFRRTLVNYIPGVNVNRLPGAQGIVAVIQTSTRSKVRIISAIPAEI